jgi:hypothetical protein
MAQVQRQQAVAKLVFRNPLFDFIREFHQPAPARGDGQLMEGLTKHIYFR